MGVAVRPRRRPRNPICLAAATAGVLLLTSCGLNGGGASGGEQNAIDVWFPGVNQAEMDLVNKTIVPAFEKETGAEVKVTFYDWPELSTKLNAAFAAGTAPDAFGHGPAAVADFVAHDRLEPLDGYVKKMDAKDVKDLEQALPGGQVGGTQYLIPLSMLGNLIAYSADDFKKAGLDPDKPPTTWEGVYDAAKKMTERKGGEITHAGLLMPTQPIGIQQTFASLLGSGGGEQISADGKKATFASPAGVQAVSYLTKLFDGSGAVAGDFGADYISAPPAQQPLVTGDAAMTVQTPNVIQQMMDAKPDLDLRIMPAPKFENGQGGAAVGGAGPGLVINKDSAEKELAWKFISYMISPETSVTYTEGIGAVPVRASAAMSEYVKNSPVIQAFVEAVPTFKPNPNVPGWVQIRDMLSKYLEQAVSKKVAPEKALKQAAAEADAILAKGGS